nr:hypothetical protein [uncultured bacterium]
MPRRKVRSVITYGYNLVITTVKNCCKRICKTLAKGVSYLLIFRKNNVGNSCLACRSNSLLIEFFK